MITCKDSPYEARVGEVIEVDTSKGSVTVKVASGCKITKVTGDDNQVTLEYP